MGQGRIRQFYICILGQSERVNPACKTRCQRLADRN